MSKYFGQTSSELLSEAADALREASGVLRRHDDVYPDYFANYPGDSATAILLVARLTTSLAKNLLKAAAEVDTMAEEYRAGLQAAKQRWAEADAEALASGEAAREIERLERLAKFQVIRHPSTQVQGGDNVDR